MKTAEWTRRVNAVLELCSERFADGADKIYRDALHHNGSNDPEAEEWTFGDEVRELHLHRPRS